jgi:uncharacterized protein YlzI (FlbEa/FlbD family)
METKYFPLGSAEDNKLIKFMRIFFGVACIALAIYWLIFNIRAERATGSIWVIVFFLTIFGIYQVLAGFGKATRFITISQHSLSIKQNAFIPAEHLNSDEINKIEFFPLKVVFTYKSGKKYQVRFGTINYETNEKIIDELVSFCESNNIPSELVEEEL